jgi:hypothetical protein
MTDDDKPRDLVELLLAAERSRVRWMIAAILGWVVAAWFVWASLGEIGRTAG